MGCLSSLVIILYAFCGYFHKVNKVHRLKLRHTVLVKELLNSFITELLFYFFQSESWFLYLKDLKLNTILQKHIVFII